MDDVLDVLYQVDMQGLIDVESFLFMIINHPSNPLVTRST